MWRALEGIPSVRAASAGHANVPKEQASGLGGRSLRTRPVRVAEATGAGAGTLNRNQGIRCRLPLRDDHSIAVEPSETQYHLSPNLDRIGRAIHTPSTTATPVGGCASRNGCHLVPEPTLRRSPGAPAESTEGRPGIVPAMEQGRPTG